MGGRQGNQVPLFAARQGDPEVAPAVRRGWIQTQRLEVTPRGFGVIGEIGIGNGHVEPGPGVARTQFQGAIVGGQGLFTLVAIGQGGA